MTPSTDLSWKRVLLSLPGLLTLSRVPLALCFPWMARNPWLGLLVLALAGLSDVADGWVARRRGLASKRGAALDPIVDKLFVGSVVLALWLQQALGLWSLLLLCSRELIELPLAVWLAVSPRARELRMAHMSANWLGKLATTLQFATVAAILFGVAHWHALIVTAIVGVVAGVWYWRCFLGSRAPRLPQWVRRASATIRRAVQTFLRIDGAEWAGAFAFNAFFSFSPLIILFVTAASFFIDRQAAGRAIIAYVESYVPLDAAMQARVFGAISDMIRAREKAGVVALLILVWTALQCFTTLVRAANRAFGQEAHGWWRLPLKGLVLFGIMAGAVLLGVGAPILGHVRKAPWFHLGSFGAGISAVWGFVVPPVLAFLSLSLLYALAPRRPMAFAQVWAAALCATLLLQATQLLFVVYLEHFATLNAVYGALGGIMAVLLWIYLSGCIFIFGACLCAAQTEFAGTSANTTGGAGES